MRKQAHAEWAESADVLRLRLSATNGRLTIYPERTPYELLQFPWLEASLLGSFHAAAVCMYGCTGSRASEFARPRS